MLLLSANPAQDCADRRQAVLDTGRLKRENATLLKYLSSLEAPGTRDASSACDAATTTSTAVPVIQRYDGSRATCELGGCPPGNGAARGRAAAEGEVDAAPQIGSRC